MYCCVLNVGRVSVTMRCVFIFIYFSLVCVSVHCYNTTVRNNLKTPDTIDCNEDVSKPLFLTPLIQASKIREAQVLSKVEPEIGNITSYSGFLTTNETCGNNLFFWFFPAQEDWENAPLVLWLEGGPGCPSIDALFQENGPFSYSSDDGLKIREYSWNVKNNLLYIDQPVGTGFSFTEKGCYAEDQISVGENLYSALIQFLKLFPNLQQNKFFITGESYAGKFIPAIGYTIHTKNPSAKLKIDLVGMMIRNGWTDPREQIKYGDYLYQLGFIDDTERKEFYKSQKEFVYQIDNKDWAKAAETQIHIFNLIKKYANVSLNNYLIHKNQVPRDWDTFLNCSKTRKSIHVGNLEFATDLTNRSKTVYNRLHLDWVQSVKPWVEILLDNGYPMVFYVGQLDIICAYPMVINFLRSLHWSGQAQYLNATRHKWREGEDLAGYIKTSNNLADVLVRNAGHMVSIEQPFWAYQLVNRFTSGGIQGLIRENSFND